MSDTESRRRSTLPTAVHDFHRWLSSQWETGVIGPERERNSSDPDAARRFLPLNKLKEYFDPKKKSTLRKLLKAVCPLAVDHDLIGERHVWLYYLQVLAILVFIGKGDEITSFIEYESLADDRLPLEATPPEDFPWQSSPEQNFYPQFLDAQWKFCVKPMKWVRRTELRPQRILPIISRTPIGSGSSATTYRIELHPDYNQLREFDGAHVPPDDPEYHTFVLKTYAKTEQDHYDNEVAAFLRVRHSHYGPTHTPGFIGFYGSFKQDGVFNIILEWANHGTLENYFQNESPPRSLSDSFKFWKSLFGLVAALKSIHEVRKQESSNPHLVGWHQDIKPENILVCRKRENSIYECEFKLADLGLSHFKTKKGETTHDIALHGNRTYGAPECYRTDEFSHRLRITVTPLVDVWSFGCVLSESVTWVVYGLHGRYGLDKYRQNRVEATRGIPNHQSIGCFHDGNEVLPTVKVQHEHLRSDTKDEDKITKEALHLSDRMLWHEKHRETASYLYNHSQRMLGASPPPAADPPDPDPEAPRTPPRSAPPPSQEAISPSFSGGLSESNTPSRAGPSRQSLEPTPPSTPIGYKPQPWPIEEAKLWREGKKSTKSFVHELDDGCRKELNKRDFTIVVDDSSTMREHWAQVVELVDLLVFVLKDFDTNGIDLLFTNLEEKHNSKSLDQLVNWTKSKCPSEGPNLRRTNMDLSLGPILTDYTSKMSKAKGKGKKGVFDRAISKASSWVHPVKPSVVYVLTDGLWQPHDDELKSLIKNLLNALIDSGIQGNQFGIQFVQFGQNSAGTERLVNLDRVRSGESKKDIVDHERADGDFNKILLGAINRWYDADPDL